jgi:thiol:disulfide interchange protein DsbC
MEMISRIILLVFLGLNVSNVAATVELDTVAVQERLVKLYPATKFESIKPSVIPGLYEVVMGKNVAYVEATGRYFVFGHIYDMTKQQDLTEGAAKTLSKISFMDLPLNDAIKIVRGNGNRIVAVFTDPDCPYCKQLEKELNKLTDLTIYTFLYPIVGLHPDARNKAIAIWCAEDRNSAWVKVMDSGPVPAYKECNNPIDKNIALAGKFGINGTPTLINKFGRVMPGAANSDQLEVFISMKD